MNFKIMKALIEMIVSAIGNAIGRMSNAQNRTEENQVQTNGNSDKAKTAANGANDLDAEIVRLVRERYETRYNLLNQKSELRLRTDGLSGKPFTPYTRYARNSIVLRLHQEGCMAWNGDVDRVMESEFVNEFHPFASFLSDLPRWDGTDRVLPLAQRVSTDPLWCRTFHRWMRAMVAVWHNAARTDCREYAEAHPKEAGRADNALIPLLVSEQQGARKSTFCRMLLPESLRGYYTDKFELAGNARLELSMARYGLVNLDEFDRYDQRQMAKLKNLVQLGRMSARRAYSSHVTELSRIASFIGTSNQMDLLTDATGSRRFFCQEVEGIIDCETPIDYAQLYAQLLSEVLADEPTFFTHEEEENIQRHNRRFYNVTPVREVFLACYKLADPETPGTEKQNVCADRQNYEWLTATQILTELHRSSRRVLLKASPSQLGKELMLLRAKHRRTKRGTVYCVKRIEATGA